jgi:hypothetical protein
MLFDYYSRSLKNIGHPLTDRLFFLPTTGKRLPCGTKLPVNDVPSFPKDWNFDRVGFCGFIRNMASKSGIAGTQGFGRILQVLFALFPSFSAPFPTGRGDRW